MYTIELPWWVMLLPVMAIAVCLYFALRNRVSLWLLIPLVIVLAPVGVLVLNVDAMFLSVWLLTLYSMLLLRIYGGVTIGYNSQPYPLQVYLLEGAAALLIVAVIVYLIRRS